MPGSGHGQHGSDRYLVALAELRQSSDFQTGAPAVRCTVSFPQACNSFSRRGLESMGSLREEGCWVRVRRLLIGVGRGRRCALSASSEPLLIIPRQPLRRVGSHFLGV
jgi:hypothetical protein